MCHLRKTIVRLILVSLFFPLSAFANNFNYYQIKLGTGVFNTANGSEVVPLISIGTRFELDDSAIEISTGYGNHNHGDKFSYYTLPKVTYVKFHEPNANSGFYYGGGLSFSSMKYSPSYHSDNSYNKFTGIFAEGTVGYEFRRNAAICPIVYLDISQPMVAESKVGRHPGLAAMLGLSVGIM